MVDEDPEEMLWAHDPYNPRDFDWSRAARAEKEARTVLESGTASTAEQATALHTLALSLWPRNRFDEAVTALKESIATRRPLADADPADHRRPLADALTMLGCCYSRLDVPYRDATAAHDEALEIHRELVRTAEYPPTQQYVLAQALTTFAAELRLLRDEQRSALIRRELVTVLRDLTEEDAFTFEPALGVELYNLAVALSRIGEIDEAIDAQREGVDLFRALAHIDADRWGGELADAERHLAHLRRQERLR